MSNGFANFYDFVMQPFERRAFNRIRKNLIQGLGGRVLEIGSGTGVNFPLYQSVDQVDAIEPNPKMMEKSTFRRKQAAVPIHLHIQSAEELSFHDDSFDSVVATLVFCSISDPMKALKEVQRVSKPGATVVFFEHVKMDHPFLGKLQDMLNPVWRRVADGCHLNRNTLDLIKTAGFKVEKVQSYYKGLFLSVKCTNSD